MCNNEDKFIDYDPLIVLKCSALAYVTDDAKKLEERQEIKEEIEESNLRAKINIIDNRPIYKSVISKLSITNTHDIFKTLLISVIDKSGSMGGKPIEQKIDLYIV